MLFAQDHGKDVLVTWLSSGFSCAFTMELLWPILSEPDAIDNMARTATITLLFIGFFLSFILKGVEFLRMPDARVMSASSPLPPMPVDPECNSHR